MLISGADGRRGAWILSYRLCHIPRDQPAVLKEGGAPFTVRVHEQHLEYLRRVLGEDALPVHEGSV